MSDHSKSYLNLTSSTPIGKDELKKLQIIVQSLFDNNDSVEFRNPVDWEGLGINDYPDVIKSPMDLGTVKSKLTANKYQLVEECVEELQLIWDNCKTFNAENSWIYNLAEKLERYFRKLVKNYLPSIMMPNTVSGGGGGQKRSGSNKSPLQDQLGDMGAEEIFQEDLNQNTDTQDVIPYNEKIKFSSKIKFLSVDHLAIIITLIKNNSPSAFKEIDKERGQIIVDNIEPATFKTINEQMDTWTSSLKENPVKKVKR